jgi:hypothetical protein
MRYWGENIEIDGSYYTRAQKQFLPTDAEMAQYKASGNFLQNEGNVELFESTVQQMLKDIEGNRVGKILVGGINQSPRTVRIIPLTWEENAKSKKPDGKYAVWDLTRPVQDKPVLARDKTWGLDCVIWFDLWSEMGNLSTKDRNSPYQVLVHELQHAIRQLRARWVPPRRVIPGFPNPEELFSVMIENMYLSAGGQPERMLGVYDPTVPLGSRTAGDFYKQYDQEIDAWCGQLPDLAQGLQVLSGIWNPLLARASTRPG